MCVNSWQELYMTQISSLNKHPEYYSNQVMAPQKIKILIFLHLQNRKKALILCEIKLITLNF